MPSHPPNLATPTADSSTPATAVPVNMRAGLRATPGGSLATPAAADTPKPAADLVHPVLPGSWRGIVRQGLAAVAGQEAPAQVGSVAETLALDVPRLHRAQNDFQRLVVLAACLLLAAQARSDAAAQVTILPAIRAGRPSASCLLQPGHLLWLRRSYVRPHSLAACTVLVSMLALSDCLLLGTQANAMLRPW